MKIRTNFVTNSSSYSSAEIKIDNPVLLEILQRYKEKGAFINDDGFDLGDPIGASEYDAKSEYDWDPDDNDYGHEPVAVYLYDPEITDVDYAPKKIEQVAELLMNAITREGVDKVKDPKLVKQCRKELQERKQEIIDNYNEVFWVAEDEGGDECAPEEGATTKWEFYYKKGE